MDANTKTPAAETCPHCRAFNGRSLCGCGTARALRGEIALSAAEEMAILNAIILPGFDADGRFTGKRRGRGLR